MPVSYVPSRIASGKCSQGLSRSAIISPTSGDVIIHDGKITLKGWAYSGNGNWVERVEISPDGLVSVAQCAKLSC